MRLQNKARCCCHTQHRIPDLPPLHHPQVPGALHEAQPRLLHRCDVKNTDELICTLIVPRPAFPGLAEGLSLWPCHNDVRPWQIGRVSVNQRPELLRPPPPSVAACPQPSVIIRFD